MSNTQRVVLCWVVVIVWIGVVAADIFVKGFDPPKLPVYFPFGAVFGFIYPRCPRSTEGLPEPGDVDLAV